MPDYPLNPCAGCGHPTPRLATSILWDQDYETLVYLGICDQCKALGPISSRIKEAADKWNEKQDFLRSMKG